MRKIALISEHASPLSALGGVDSGGQNVYVGQVARHLARMGYDVDVFTRRDSQAMPMVIPWEGVRVVNVDAGPPAYVRKEELLPYMPRFAEQVMRFMSREGQRYDLIHANFFMSALVACLIKAKTGIPFVVTFHALGRVRRQFHGKDDFPDERIEIEERAMRETEWVIAECPQDQEDLMRLYGAETSRVRVVPCGFDPDEFAPMNKQFARSVLGLDKDEFIVLQAGRMVPRKGVDTAIEGFGLLVKERSVPARMIVVGGAAGDDDSRMRDEMARLARIAESAGAADRITFAGRQDHDALRYYYNAADVFVTTPWYEPFGITPVEAMACGTPVIGANVGGIKFTVRDGETGYLVNPRDPAALAERLAHLYAHPKLLRLFGKQAAQRVNDLFTWDKVTRQLAAVYEDLIVLRERTSQLDAEQLAAVDEAFLANIRAVEEARHCLPSALLEAAAEISECFRRGGKVLICGNGGSAAESQHMAAELVGRFRIEGREPLPAIALTADGTILSAWSNDYGFEDVFARQVRALGAPGDVLLGLSTSGCSPNVLRAFETARAREMTCIAVTGGNGGDLNQLADQAIVVPSTDTQRIQEVHGIVVHLLCELIELRVTRPQEQAGLETRTLQAVPA